jgi:phage N-6-adenine-methyltransferase
MKKLTSVQNVLTENIRNYWSGTMAKMPQQKPGRSEQVVATPLDFLSKVKTRLGIDDFVMDLAATDDNTVTEKGWYTEEQNSLNQNWYFDGWCWLNPPYSDIRPWVSKACDEADKGAHIAMLVPASTGSNWWHNYVDGAAYITFLNGRITFIGHDKPYPKDLALLLYAPFLMGGSCIWRWK